jgi:hypothetical protein
MPSEIPFRNPAARFFRAIATLCPLLLALSWPSLAGPEIRCSPGLDLRLSAPESTQGSLLLAELRGARPLARLEGVWGGRAVTFWREDGPADVRRALLGVDLERPPGTYAFTLTARTQYGAAASCRVLVRIKAGRFATERLTIDKKFTAPSAEQINRALKERDRLRAIFDGVTPERLWQGGFRIPLDGVTTGGNFGRRRILNGNPGSPHSGVDFPAASGTPVHAAQRGRVVLAEELFFSGNTVVLDHGLGVYTFYGHLESIAVDPGDLLEAGAELGKVGATGRVTGPHLHWGLTVARARVDGLQLVHLLPR